MKRLATCLSALLGVLVASSVAGAYVPNTLDVVGGVPIVAHWPAAAFPVPFQVTPGLTTDIADGTDLQALQSALATWTAVADSAAAVYLEAEAAVEANVLDGINAIEFSNSTDLGSAGFVTLTYMLTDVDGTILEVDTLVNDRNIGFTTTAGSNVGYDLETVMLQSLGRALGFVSTPYGARESAQTVNEASPAMYVVSRSIGESKRDLEDDDIAGLSDAYPAAGSRRGAIVGTVRRGSRALFGAQVLAFDPVRSISVVALSLPDGSFRIGGLPAGRYVLEVLPLRSPATPAAIGGIFDSDFVDTTFSRVFFDQVVPVSAGQSTSVQLEVAE